MNGYIRSPRTVILSGIAVLIILSLITTPAMAAVTTVPTMGELTMETAILRATGVYSGSEGFPALEEIPDPEQFFEYEGSYEFAKLDIEPRYYNLWIQAGDNKSLNVILKNLNEEAINASSKVIIPPFAENYIEENWISISPSEKEIKPGEEESFEIEVNIPEDADSGYYEVEIAFTEDVIEYDGSYPEYINSMSLSIEVWTPPKIMIFPSYIGDMVEAGKEYDYKIMLKNIADYNITIEPEVWEGEMMYEYPPGQAFGIDAITINAPSEVKAGEIATVNVHLEVPEGARGHYCGNIKMNIDDPSIEEFNGMIYLDFNVWSQPTEPYLKTFEVQTESPVTIEVRSQQYDYYQWYDPDRERDDPSFELTLKGPEGSVTPILTGTEYSGVVDMGSDYLPPWEVNYSGLYHESMKTYIETYSLPEGATPGTWEMGVLPFNAEMFEYRITTGNKSSE